MKHFSAITLVALLTAASGGFSSHAQSPAGASLQPMIAEGIWKGSLSIRKGSSPGVAHSDNQASLSSGIELRILSSGQGALLDIPEQSMFGYPLDDVSWNTRRIRFTLNALGPDEDLVFEGIFSASASIAGSSGSSLNSTDGVIVGTANSSSWKGSFILSREATTMGSGERSFSVPTEDGSLPGTLLLPASGQTRFPLVLLLAGAGTTDRNGNNYNVPGKSDSLAMFAKALSAKGIATFRYDKRGSGEAYMLERGGEITSLATHVDDAARALRLLCSQEGKSRIIVAGMNEGAWTGAAAINRLAKEGIPVDGLVVLDASGEDPLQDLRASLLDLDETTRREADMIIEAILAGESFTAPTGLLSDFFAASRLAWLESWLSFKPAAEIAKVEAPVLFVYGSADLQVSKASFEKLLEARPNSAARIIPSMNYALKKAETEEENYQSFTDPGYPLAAGLVDLVVAFAKAKPAPSGSLPYERTTGKNQ